MLFRSSRRFDDAFLRAVRAAIASHRPATLQDLLVAHGARVFAKALSDLSGRVIADALSMLAAPQRAAVLSRLSRTARARLHDTTGGPRHAAPGAAWFLFPGPAGHHLG